MAVLAKDMDRWIEKRDELSRRREDLRRQKELALQGDSVVRVKQTVVKGSSTYTHV